MMLKHSLIGRRSYMGDGEDPWSGQNGNGYSPEISNYVFGAQVGRQNLYSASKRLGQNTRRLYNVFMVRLTPRAETMLLLRGYSK